MFPQTTIYTTLWIIFYLIAPLPPTLGAANQLTQTDWTALDSQIVAMSEEDPPEAARLARQMIISAKKNGDDMLAGRGFFLLAEAQYFQDSFQTALTNYYESRNAYHRSLPQSAAQLARTYASEGFLYFDRFQFYDRAISLLKAGLKHAQQAQDEVVVANIYSDLGSSYFHLGLFDSAASYFGAAFQIDEALGDTAHISSDLNNLGRLYVQWQDYQKGLQYYREAIQMVDTLERVRMHSILLNNIGMAFQEMGKLDSAALYILASLNKSQVLGDSVLIANRLNNLGLLAFRQQQFSQAISNFEKSLGIYERRGLHTWIARVLSNMGKVTTAQGRFNEAAEFYQRALSLAERNQELDNLAVIYQGLTKHHELRGQFQKALQFQNKLAIIRDSIFDLDSKKQLEEFNVQYATAEKQAEIDRLAFENEISEARLKIVRSQRRALALLILAMLLIGTLLFYNYRFNQQIRQKEQDQTIALQLQEIDNLQAQIYSVLHEKRSVRSTILDLEDLNKLTMAPLTKREYEILLAISQGHSNKQISELQFISINTVKFHLKNIYDKLDVKNRVQAVKKLSAEDI